MIDETGMDILLIEDNDMDAELTCRALKRIHLGETIHRLKDGQEVLDFLFQPDEMISKKRVKNPRLILLDLKLPFVSGIELLAKIKADRDLRRIPLVVLTSSAEEQDIADCYRLGANSYIVKPIEFEHFTASIQNIGLYWLNLNQSPVI
jgi:CheY-like chemotaxis protein